MPKRICAIGGCSKPASSRGWCKMHYSRWRRNGDPQKTTRVSPGTYTQCKERGCTKKPDAKGYCPKHYARAKATGELGEVPACAVSYCENLAVGGTLCSTHYQRKRLGQDLEAPLRAKAAYRDPEVLNAYTTRQGDCLIWTGDVGVNGYGYIYVGKPIKAPIHRWAYTKANGPIPDGMDVDHTCGNRACYNVKHLRLATRKQNLEHMTVLNSRNKSGYRGVYWSKQKQKWQVSVGHNGKHYHGGFYDDVHQAGEAARQLRNRLYTHNLRDR